MNEELDKILSLEDNIDKATVLMQFINEVSDRIKLLKAANQFHVLEDILAIDGGRWEIKGLNEAVRRLAIEMVASNIDAAVAELRRLISSDVLSRDNLTKGFTSRR